MEIPKFSPCSPLNEQRSSGFVRSRFFLYVGRWSAIGMAKTERKILIEGGVNLPPYRRWLGSRGAGFRFKVVSSATGQGAVRQDLGGGCMLAIAGGPGVADH